MPRFVLDGLPESLLANARAAAARTSISSKDSSRFNLTLIECGQLVPDENGPKNPEP
jgi:hypothetical protein